VIGPRRGLVVGDRSAHRRTFAGVYRLRIARRARFAAACAARAARRVDIPDREAYAFGMRDAAACR